MAGRSRNTDDRGARSRPLARRVLRFLAWGLAATAVVLVLMWTFRGAILAPLVRPRLEALLVEVLGAEKVVIGAIEGDWFAGIDVRDVAMQAKQGPLRRVSDLRVEATWSIPALLRGELDGLRSLRLTAAAVEVDLTEEAAPATVPPAPGAAPEWTDQLARVCPDGLQVAIADLTIRTPLGKRRGAFALAMDPGTAARQVRIDQGDAQVVVEGIDVDAHHVAVTALALTVPGLQTSVTQFELQEPWTGTAPVLARLRGDFAMSVDTAAVDTAAVDSAAVDSTAFPAALSASLRPLLPARTDLRGSLAGGMLHLAAGSLQARGLQLALEAGSLAVAETDWRVAAAQVRFRLAMTDLRVDVPGLGPTRGNGHVVGRIEGPLLAPVAELELDLGACDSPHGGFRTARGALRIGDEGLAVERLAVTSLLLPALGEPPLDLTCEGTGTLPLVANGPTNVAAAAPPTLRFAVARGAAGDLPEMHGTGVLQFGDRSTRLDELSLSVGDLVVRGGVVAGRGLTALLAGDALLATLPLQGTFELAAADLACLPPAWLGGLQLQGRVQGTLGLSGTIDALVPVAQLAWSDGSLVVPGLPAFTGITLRADLGEPGAPGASVLALQLSADVPVGPDRQALTATASVHTDENGTRLEPMVVRLGAARFEFAAATSLRRSDLLRGATGNTPPSLQGELHWSDVELAALPMAQLGIGEVKGRLDGSAAFAGSFGDAWSQLLSSAQLALRGGDVRPGAGPRLEDLAADVSYTPDELVVQSLTGTSGAGAFQAHGSLRHESLPLLAAWEEATLDLRVAGTDVLLWRGDGAKVRADVALTATGTPAATMVRGEVVLGRGSKYVRRISVLPDLHARGGRAPGPALRAPRLPSPFGERLDFDVAVRTEAPFEVRTHLFDGDLDVAMRLLGRGDAARLEGTVAVQDGMLRFPGANLRVLTAQLSFPRSEGAPPDLAIRAEGKRMGIQVAMTVSGTYDRPEVLLTSVPPLQPQDLIVLLTTGQLPSTLVQSGALGHARIVGGYLATEAYEAWFGSESTERGESMLDRLSVEAGREVSRNGIESLLVEYELRPTLALRVERDAYEDYNLGLVLRFRFP